MRQKHPVIAHVLHRLYLAGAEVLAADMARRLNDRYRFVFFCLDEIGPLGQQLIGEGFQVFDLHRRPGVDRSCANGIRRLVRQLDVGLIHAHQYTPFFYAACSRRFGARPRILFTEHGRHYPDYRRVKRVLANKCLLRRCDRVTAVGRFVKQALIDHEGLAANRIEVIYNGIDPEPFQRLATDQARVTLRSELGLKSDQLLILQVARFHQVKDHATVIRALAHVIRSVPEAVLVLAGDGEQRVAIQTLAHEMGVTNSLRILGVRQDIPHLMASADVFTLSSLSEGVSVTLLEAMAAGLPIVATDVGGNPEVVIDQQTGLLSPRGDAAALAKNLLRLLSDTPLRKQMGRAGKDRVKRQFSQKQMHLAYAQIYEDICARA